MVSDLHSLQRMPLLDLEDVGYICMSKEDMDDFCVKIAHRLLEELYPTSLEDQARALRKALDKKVQETFALYAYLQMPEDGSVYGVPQIQNMSNMSQGALLRSFGREISVQLLNQMYPTYPNTVKSSIASLRIEKLSTNDSMQIRTITKHWENVAIEKMQSADKALQRRQWEECYDGISGFPVFPRQDDDIEEVTYLCKDLTGNLLGMIALETDAGCDEIIIEGLALNPYFAQAYIDRGEDSQVALALLAAAEEIAQYAGKKELIYNDESMDAFYRKNGFVDGREFYSELKREVPLSEGDSPDKLRTQMAWKVVMDVAKAVNPIMYKELQLLREYSTQGMFLHDNRA